MSNLAILFLSVASGLYCCKPSVLPFRVVSLDVDNIITTSSRVFLNWLDAANVALLCFKDVPGCCFFSVSDRFLLFYQSNDGIL